MRGGRPPRISTSSPPHSRRSTDLARGTPATRRRLCRDPPRGPGGTRWRRWTTNGPRAFAASTTGSGGLKWPQRGRLRWPTADTSTHSDQGCGHLIAACQDVGTGANRWVGDGPGPDGRWLDTVAEQGSGMTRRWVRALVTAVGIGLIGVARLVWWSAEQALPPTPEVQWSSGGGMFQCLGDRSCDPPVIPSGTVAVIVSLVGLGAALVAAVAVDVVRRWRPRPATTG